MTERKNGKLGSLELGLLSGESRCFITPPLMPRTRTLSLNQPNKQLCRDLLCSWLLGRRLGKGIGAQVKALSPEAIVTEGSTCFSLRS